MRPGSGPWRFGTLDSFNLALEQHADILEMDIAMPVDGELFVIHDGMESRLFHITENVQHLRAEKIHSLEYYTLNHNLSGVFPNTFDEVLEHFKGKRMLNLDRCWLHPDKSKNRRRYLMQYHGMRWKIR